MVTKKSWQEFRESGLLWWINMILHTFGWSIVVDVENEHGEEIVTDAYPARVKFRGFEGESNDRGYRKVSKFLQKTVDELVKEAEE